MTSTPHIQLAVNTAIARGISRSSAAPPLHRLLWALGFAARPPHYASFGFNALLLGGFWGLFMAVFSGAYAFVLRPERGLQGILIGVGIALVAAVGFGLAMALVFRAVARKAKLPAWDELAVVEG